MTRSLARYRYPATPTPILRETDTSALSLLENYDLLPTQGNSGEASQKKQYLLDCCFFLEHVAAHLAQHDFCEKAIWALPGGRAVAGDASANYWQRNPCRGLHVSIVAGLDESCAGRADGVSIMTRVLTPEDPGGRKSATYWLTANASSQQIAQVLMEIFHGHILPVLTPDDILHPNPARDFVLQVR